MSKTTALVAAAGLAAAWNAHANDINWLNPSGGSFATASNWSPAHVPGAADRAIFNRGSSYIVHLNGVGHTNSQLLVSNDTVQFNLDGATYSLTSSASLSVGGGSIIIFGHPVGLDGSFFMQSTTPSTGTFNSVNAYIGGNSATVLGGSGRIDVYGGVTWHNPGLLLVGGGAPGTLNILGSGVVTSGTGLIGQTAPGTATVDTAGSTWTLTGILDIASNADGTLNITNGGQVYNAAVTCPHGSYHPQC